MQYLSTTGAQQNAFSRLDDNRIGNLSKEAAKVENKSDAQLKELAQKFESIFVNLLLKEMRQTVPKSELMQSFSGDMYQSLFDEEVAAHISSAKGIGLADALYSQLSRLKTESENAARGDAEQAGGTKPKSDTLAQPKEVQR